MNSVLIFAGGVGTRMKSTNNTPKQFLKVDKKPIIIYTLEKFEACEDVDNIVVVCIESWIKRLNNYLEKYNIKKVSAVIPGGETGFESRLLGLEHLVNNAQTPKDDIVILHDGVRPIIKSSLISNNINLARKHGNCITVGRAMETISIVNYEGMIEKTIDRAQCRYARAPQTFYLQEIYDGYKTAQEHDREDLIDSASVYEFMGKHIYTVEGPEENIKITTPLDYYMFKGIVQAQKSGKFEI